MKIMIELPDDMSLLEKGKGKWLELGDEYYKVLELLMTDKDGHAIFVSPALEKLLSDPQHTLNDNDICRIIEDNQTE